MTEEKEFTWFMVANIAGKRRAPKWARQCALDSANQLWVPAAMAGNEQMVLLCASFDGEPVFLHDHHLYVRASWMEREHPDIADLIGRMRDNVIRAAATQ